MDAVAERLDAGLSSWQPAVSQVVRARVAEIIELAEDDLLDIMRSREAEQEILDMIDEPPSR